MNKKVVIYTWTVCPFCVRAKRLFDDKGIPYEEINLDGRDDEFNALKEKTGMKTVPQIFIDDKLVGGYRELSAFEATGELDRLLNS